jgi:hypothetical protein
MVAVDQAQALQLRKIVPTGFLFQIATPEFAFRLSGQVLASHHVQFQDLVLRHWAFPLTYTLV